MVVWPHLVGSTVLLEPPRLVTPPVIGGIEYSIPLQRGGNLSQPVAVQRHLINTAHYGDGLRLNHPKVGSA